MSELTEEPRARRADAVRSRTEVLEAAARLLGERPDAGMAAIAQAAGVTRQTVYAHFSSRDDLLTAVVDHATVEAVAALDAAGLDEGPAADALLRIIGISWQILDRYPVLLRPEAADVPGDAERHHPVVVRLTRIIERGQESGEFDRMLSADWLAAAVIALGHAAGGEVAAERLSVAEAQAALRVSLLRLVGAE
jgi:AcrR family transcriptional regulator